MLILVAPSTSTTAENIEAVKKISLDNRRIIIRLLADDVADILDTKCATAKIVQ